MARCRFSGGLTTPETYVLVKKQIGPCSEPLQLSEQNDINAVKTTFCSTWRSLVCQKCYVNLELLEPSVETFVDCGMTI